MALLKKNIIFEETKMIEKFIKNYDLNGFIPIFGQNFYLCTRDGN